MSTRSLILSVAAVLIFLVGMATTTFIVNRYKCHRPLSERIYDLADETKEDNPFAACVMLELADSIRRGSERELANLCMERERRKFETYIEKHPEAFHADR